MSSTTPKLHRLGQLEIAGEATFGTEVTANYEHVQCVSVDRSGLETEAIENMAQKQDLYELERIIGRSQGTITTTHYIHGYSSTVPSGAQTFTEPAATGSDGFDMLVGALASAFGGLASDWGLRTGGDLSSSTTSVLKDADLSTFTAGQPVSWITAGGTYASNWIKELDTGAAPNEATLLLTESTAPQGSAAYGGAAVYVDRDAFHEGTTKSFSLRVSGHDSDDRLVATGCHVVGVSMSFELGGLPTMTLTWGVGAWEEEGSGGAPTVQTWSFPACEAVKGSAEVVWGTTKASTRPLTGLNFDLGITKNPINDHNAENGIGGWYTVDIRPRVTFSVLRDVSEEPTDFAAQTTQPFMATFGSQPGKMFSLLIPNAGIESFPGFQDGDGAMMAPVSLYADYYNGDTGSDACNSICRFAWI